MSNPTENNRLIAEFMGMKHLNTKIDSHNFEQYTYSMPDVLSIQVYGYAGAECFLEDQFQKSWDWLMPAAKKFCDLPYMVGLDGYKNMVKRRISEFDMEGAIQYLVNGITYYNENKNP